jgi:hypothetical protein
MTQSPTDFLNPIQNDPNTIIDLPEDQENQAHKEIEKVLYGEPVVDDITTPLFYMALGAAVEHSAQEQPTANQTGIVIDCSPEVIDMVADYGGDAAGGVVESTIHTGLLGAAGAGFVVGLPYDAVATEIGHENNWGDAAVADAEQLVYHAHEYSSVLGGAAQEVTHEFLEENACPIINGVANMGPPEDYASAKSGYEVGSEPPPTFDPPSPSHHEPEPELVHEDHSSGWFSSQDTHETSHSYPDTSSSSSWGDSQHDNGHEEQN